MTICEVVHNSRKLERFNNIKSFSLDKLEYNAFYNFHVQIQTKIRILVETE